MDIIPAAMRLSQLVIDVDKDWAGHVIKNVGAPTAGTDVARPDMAGMEIRNLGAPTATSSAARLSDAIIWDIALGG